MFLDFSGSIDFVRECRVNASPQNGRMLRLKMAQQKRPADQPASSILPIGSTIN